MADLSQLALEAFSDRLNMNGFSVADTDSLIRMHSALPIFSALINRIHQPLSLEDEPAHLPRFVSSVCLGSEIK